MAVLLIQESTNASLGRIALTDRTVRALKPPTVGRVDVWDEDDPRLRCFASRPTGVGRGS